VFGINNFVHKRISSQFGKILTRELLFGAAGLISGQFFSGAEVVW
jgi:hypothetical protein